MDMEGSNKTINSKELEELFNAAEKNVQERNDLEAEQQYLQILKYQHENVYCLFRLGEIYNRKKEPLKSLEYHTKAFEIDPFLAKKLVAENHSSYHYEYKKTDEITIDKCPLCGEAGTAHSCYNDITNIDFIEGFNPIRLWMYCEKCNHIFARNFPLSLNNTVANSPGIFHMVANVNALSPNSEIVKMLKGYSKGKKLLDVGVGAGELAAVSKEYGLDYTGIEIRKAYADQVSINMEVKVHHIDFMEYQPEESYDIVVMGDVIEHIPNPVEAIKKANSLLDAGGIIWVSTPNFNSAFSYIAKDNDPMWRVCEHLNYFSFTSLKKLLEESGFSILEYNSSKHYRGSMEVTAVKISDCDLSFESNIKKDEADKINAFSKINITDGKNIKSGWGNLSFKEGKGIDIVADFENLDNEPLPLPENSVDEIYASHIIERIKRPLPFMQELHRIAKQNAKAVFECYYGASDEANSNDDFVRFYFINSFPYFSQPFYWRADYGYRGDWLITKLTLTVDKKYKSLETEKLMYEINKKRNVAKKMIVEMKAIKPIRPSKKELQEPININIEFV